MAKSRDRKIATVALLALALSVFAAVVFRYWLIWDHADRISFKAGASGFALLAAVAILVMLAKKFLGRLSGGPLISAGMLLASLWFQSWTFPHALSPTLLYLAGQGFGLAILWQAYRCRREWGIRTLRLIFLAVISLDLLWAFHLAGRTYEGVSSPAKTLDAGLFDVSKPLLPPGPREVPPLRPWTSVQALRYPELFTRRTVLFSPVRRFPAEWKMYREESETEALKLIPQWSMVTLRQYFLLLESPYASLLRRPADLKKDYPDELDLNLRSRNWNTYLYLKPAFILRHSGLGAPVLRSLFAVDQPPFQYREGAVLAGEKGIMETLEQISTLDDGTSLLSRYVVLGEDSEKLSPATPLLSLPSVPSEDPMRTKFSVRVKEPYASYNNFHLDVESARSGLLYWADGFDEGWTAKRDGREVHVFRANGNFKAVEIPRGNSTLEFTYDPVFFRVSAHVFLLVTVLTSMFIGLLAIFQWCRGRT